MSAMVGARKALLVTRFYPRGELASALVSPARRVDSLLPSLPAGRGCLRSLVPYRGAGSLAAEQIEGYYLRERERGVHSAGNYGEFHSDHPKDHLNRQMQRDLHSASSSKDKDIDRNGCEHVSGSINAHYERNSEQHYRTGGSYCLPNAHQPYTGVRLNNGTPGYNARQPYGRSSAYNHQSPNGDIPNTHEKYNGTLANNGLSGDGKLHCNDCDTHSSGYNSQTNQQSYTSEQYRYSTSGQSYQNSTGNGKQVFQKLKVDQRSDGYHISRSGNSSVQYPNPSGSCKENVAGFQQGYNGDFGYNTKEPYGSSSTHNHQGPKLAVANQRPLNVHDTHIGYNSGINQHNYTNERFGYSHPGQSYETSTVNDQQVFHQQEVDERSGGNYTNMPRNSTSGNRNPSSFHKEHVTGPQQGQNGDFGYNASQAYQSHYASIKVDSQRYHLGYSMNVNGDVQRNSHGVYQDKHSDIQHVASAGNNLSSTPYQDSINCEHSLPSNLSNGGSSSEVSGESSGKSKGTIEELDKLCEDGKVKEALEVLTLLQEKGIVLHASQYFKLMQACGDASALVEARKIHDQIPHSELAADVINKILDMYAKCASMEDAKKLFSTMDQHDVTSWTTIISGFVHNGLGEEATDFFDQFKKTGDKPDPAMFSHILLACGILGSVDEGMLHFESMQKDFDINPTMDHYTSIVNMLGQSGYIDEALEFIKRMPVEPSIDVWESLMNMCRLNGFLELGDRCAQIIEKLDPSRLGEQSKMGLFPVNSTDLAKEKQRKKANTVEARSKVHEYRAGDRSHPDTLKIYEELRYLAAHLKEAGYVADTRFVLHDVDQETKEEALLAHSERLAISYGLMTSAVRSPIRVIKNLRSCGDCHTALKIISKLVGRQIIARDAKRFHHFENGVCSCKDYW